MAFARDRIGAIVCSLLALMAAGIPAQPKMFPARLSPAPAAGARVSFTGTGAFVALPPDANECALYSVRGERLWCFRRTAPGMLRIAVPRAVRSAGISCVTYSANEPRKFMP